MAPPPSSTRPEELENSRLGVIYFLGNLQVDFSPQQSATELKNEALTFVQGKVGDGKIMTAVTKVGGAVAAIDGKVDQISLAIRKWLAEKFDFSKSDVELAVQHVRYNLPSLIYGLQEEVGKTAGDFGVTGMASGLYTGITKTIEFFNLEHVGKGVALESGHPDIVAMSIKRSIAKSALVGLAEAALAGAKAALAAFTGGAGLIVNKVSTSEGVVLHQGQFDKGVTYLNALKSSAADLILQIQQDMRISSTEPLTAALLKHAANIGLVQKEAGSSWRARLFGWSHQSGKASQALNWVLDKAGYKQSTPFGPR